MKILFASWEMDPFYKTGGLGDVARDLPGALYGRGIDIRCVLPYYEGLKIDQGKVFPGGSLKVDYGFRTEEVKIFKTSHPSRGFRVYLFKNDSYLSSWSNPETFVFFSKAIAEFAYQSVISWTPDIIHVNDHHASLVPLIIRASQIPAKTVLSIHNISYQGTFSGNVIKNLDIDKQYFTSYDFERNTVNAMAEGVKYADRISTVSPTYAKEILTHEYGCGLNKLLEERKDRLSGILNGIDIPWPDQFGAVRPKAEGWKETKNQNKAHLQRVLGLEQGEQIPVFAYIGRFDPAQKGIDILLESIEMQIEGSIQFVILGMGDPLYEEKCRNIALKHRKKVYVEVGFNDDLAHRIYASSDFTLIPSRFEPCGLVQMLSMAYGALPIGRKTGGLADSITDGRNGFLFEDYSAQALSGKIKQARELHANPEAHKAMTLEALRTDFSWDKSAGEYIRLYEGIMGY